MATNIYGVCRGSSASKYDVWVNVSEDSVDSLNNTSRITVKMYLKRNDGNSASAYNLYEQSNSVTLELNGVNKVSKNLPIDTRNGATVLLASYTQTVSHNDDGLLKLKIDGVFTMGNTSLSGGSVSGEFKCTSIPRASVMSFSATTVNPGDKVDFTISSPSQSFSHKVTWSLGDKSDSVSLSAGVLSSGFVVPKEWSEEITLSSAATLLVSITTFNGSVAIGTKGYDIKFLIPATEEYKPRFEISIEKDNGAVANIFDQYIKGVSVVTIKPDNLSFSYGASLAAVTMTVGDVSIRRIPATFNLNQSGDELVTVAVRDTRGMLSVKTMTITVLDYEKPSVEIISVERCNRSGVKESLGTCGLLNYRVGYSSLDGENQPTIRLKYRKTNEESYTDGGIVDSSPFIFGDGGLSVGSSYVVCLSVNDSLTSEGSNAEAYISGGDIPFNIRKGGKGASFGKFSEEDMLLDVGWNMRVSGDMEISGALNFENVGCESTDLTSNMVAKVQYYPCFNMVFLRLRVDTLRELSAGVVHHIATVNGRLPGVFTPLSVTSSYGSGSHSSAGITYGNGNVVVWSDKAVAQGTKIYINGFYIAD